MGPSWGCLHAASLVALLWVAQAKSVLEGADPHKLSTRFMPVCCGRRPGVEACLQENAGWGSFFRKLVS